VGTGVKKKRKGEERQPGLSTKIQWGWISQQVGTGKKKPTEFWKGRAAFGVRRFGEKKPIEFWI
jgi:hypothetical protein